MPWRTRARGARGQEGWRHLGPRSQSLPFPRQQDRRSDTGCGRHAGCHTAHARGSGRRGPGASEDRRQTGWHSLVLVPEDSPHHADGQAEQRQEQQADRRTLVEVGQAVVGDPGGGRAVKDSWVLATAQHPGAPLTPASPPRPLHVPYEHPSSRLTAAPGPRSPRVEQDVAGEGTDLGPRPAPPGAHGPTAAGPWPLTLGQQPGKASPHKLSFLSTFWQWPPGPSEPDRTPFQVWNSSACAPTVLPCLGPTCIHAVPTGSELQRGGREGEAGELPPSALPCSEARSPSQHRVGTGGLPTATGEGGGPPHGPSRAWRSRGQEAGHQRG